MLRSIVAAAVIFAAAPALAAECSTYMPPPAARAAPTVPFDVHYIAAAQLHHLCGRDDAMGCSYPVGNRWIVVIDEAQSAFEKTCTLTYEKAHMPPNSWGDPAVEPADVMAYYGLRYY